MVSKIQKWGNSLGLRIPKAFAREVQVGPGSTVDVTVRNGRIIITPREPNGYELADLLAEVTPENLHGEEASGDAVGREVW